VEDAHRYLSGERPPEQRGDRTLLELAVAETRRYGWGFLIVDQMPSMLSRYILDNAGTVFAHRLTNLDSYRVVKSALGGMPLSTGSSFDQQEQDPLVLRLPENLALFKRYLDPGTKGLAVGVTMVPRMGAAPSTRIG
jgi:DNA helicase HerA-like ATPase